MDSVQSEKNKIGNLLLEVMRNGQMTFDEADSRVNNASRRLVQAMHTKHGKVWFGLINRYDNNTPFLREYNPAETLYNFGACFVIPVHDAELERLLKEREETPYTGTKQDAKLVAVIFDKIKELGGEHLHWC